MPRPLTSLTADEQHLYRDLADAPVDDFRPQLLADLAEEQGQERRAALLRAQTRLPLLELLRGRALAEEESPPGEAHERDLCAALGPPRRGDAMLALLAPGGALDAERLQEQYAFQVTLLASLDMLEDHDGSLGLTGIDRRFQPLPSLDAIQQRLDTPALRRKVAQGFDRLLLVPFALPLQRLTDAWQRALLRNEHLLQAHGGLEREQPLWVWGGMYGLVDGRGPDEDGRLAYAPRRFAPDHGGRTKAQLLASEPGSGWQVLLTEGALQNIPRAGRGRTIAGRRQSEAGRSPRQYLDANPSGEVGWTPETYIAAFCTALERGGQVLDDETASYLTGSYLPASGRVPYAFWDPGYRRADLGGHHPDRSTPLDGARAAVRVI